MPGGTYVDEGSSPLTRGKPAASCLSGITCGPIPAHAGKTVSPSSISSLMWAHPRSCGENNDLSAGELRLQGSSPLTRGKRGLRRVPGVVDRLIPAHAGKTTRRSSGGPPGAAHPRSCRENGAVAVGPIFPHGSSPLMQGKLDVRDVVPPGGGLIPAHTGKTLERWDLRPSWRAHPRSCGENLMPSILPDT